MKKTKLALTGLATALSMSVTMHAFAAEDTIKVGTALFVWHYGHQRNHLERHHADVDRRAEQKRWVVG